MYDAETTKKLDAIYDQINELENEIESLNDGLDAMELEVDDSIVAIKNVVNDKILALELKIEELNLKADHIMHEAHDKELVHIVIFRKYCNQDVMVELVQNPIMRKYARELYRLKVSKDPYVCSQYYIVVDDVQYRMWNEMHDIADYLNVGTSRLHPNVLSFSSENRDKVNKLYDELARRYVVLKDRLSLSGYENFRFVDIPYYVD